MASIKELAFVVLMSVLIVESNASKIDKYDIQYVRTP